jgi:hypothetical protein
MDNRIREYERRKAEIEATATSYEEYQERIKKLAKELRI